MPWMEVHVWALVVDGRCPHILVAAAAGDEEANRDEIRKVGIEESTLMAERLIAEGVPDLHFMTMNFARATQEVLHNLGMAPAWGREHGHDAVR